MFDDCFIVDLRRGQQLVFVREFGPLPPSRARIRGLLDDVRDLEDLAGVVQQISCERLCQWDGARPRDEVLDRAAALLAQSGYRVLTTGRRQCFTGRAPNGAGVDEDVYSRTPMLSDLLPREPEPTPTYVVEFEVTTDDGVAIEGAQFEVKNTRGFAVRCRSDAAGRARTGAPLDELYAIRVLADIVLPAPPDEAKTVKGLAMGRLEGDTLEVSVNHRHTFVVARPRAKVISIDRWVEARPVLLFGTMSQAPEGPTTVRGALRRVFTEAGAGELHVVGHADTQGKAGDNEALALERARSVHLYLAGDRATWAEHAFANADVATLQAALAWAAAAGGFACDPGPIDNDWGPATADALAVLREHAGIDQSQPLGADDWAAFFDLYDDDLARILLTDREGVAAARGRLKLAAEPLTMGERWPVNAPELSDHECPDNRRVDLVMCAAGTTPKPDTDEIYDGTFVREQLHLAPECAIQIIVTNPGFQSIPTGVVLVEVGPLGRRLLMADSGGVVSATVLRGDLIRVLRANEPGGWGNMVNHVFRESTATVGVSGGHRQ